MKCAAILMILTISTGALAQTNALTIEQRMKRVMIPSIEFRQANVPDVLNFLIEEASTGMAPTHIPSIGLILTNAPTTPATTHVLEFEDGTPLVFPPLTVEYHRISLLDAVGKVTERLGLTFRFEDDQLVLFTKDGKRIIRKEGVEQGPSPYTKPEAAE